MISRAGARYLVDKEDDVSLVYELGCPAFAAIGSVQEVLILGASVGDYKRE